MSEPFIHSLAAFVRWFVGSLVGCFVLRLCCRRRRRRRRCYHRRRRCRSLSSLFHCCVVTENADWGGWVAEASKLSLLSPHSLPVPMTQSSSILFSPSCLFFFVVVVLWLSVDVRFDDNSGGHSRVRLVEWWACGRILSAWTTCSLANWPEVSRLEPPTNWPASRDAHVWLQADRTAQAK